MQATIVILLSIIILMYKNIHKIRSVYKTKNSKADGTVMKDRRYRKTEKALYGAMMELLKTKQIGDISVVELCDLADINKSTFYLHYRDIYDYYDALILELADKYINIAVEYSYEDFLSNFTEVFMKYVEFTRDSDLAKLMLGQSNYERLLSVVPDKVSEIMISKSKLEGKEAMLLRCKVFFIMSGIVGVTNKYFDMLYDDELMVALAEQIKSGV